ncbi:hypothetical protein UFOVP247_113 [uncultured Caudovirales phage]|uniref:Uncharacterized protein n=1 Tax=uncultured Caudovirales phage TaxID=2100421 RepID=A0A6J7WWL2_9CAUD|nr:hypothetical protein UFOVP247_113 [uncultured Caudovirales phage]
MDLDIEIIVRDIEELRPYKSNCFTIEKIHLFDKLPGNNVLLDIDILVLKDITTYLDEYDFDEPRFVKNHWQNIDYAETHILEGMNYVNSSMITWKDDQLKFILDFYREHKEIIEFKYEDLDTFLFHALRKKLKFHPEGMVGSYAVERYKRAIDGYRDYDYSVMMFNTSHGKGIELEDVDGEYRDLWVSYDMVY